MQDFGAGIPEDMIPYVWDRYYKVDKTHKRAVMGTGLGLSIVKNILELHDARYGVESEVGKGSTFWVELIVYQSGYKSCPRIDGAGRMEYSGKYA